MSAAPRTTRLRWVSAKDAETLELFAASLKQRVQIYEILFVKNKFYLFFVPGDTDPDIKSGSLD